MRSTWPVRMPRIRSELGFECLLCLYLGPDPFLVGSSPHNPAVFAKAYQRHAVSNAQNPIPGLIRRLINRGYPLGACSIKLFRYLMGRSSHSGGKLPFFLSLATALG